MISGLVALLLPAAALAMRIRSGRTRVATLAVGVVALMLLTAGMARFIPERGNQQSSAAALQVRWELARTSLRMLSSNPAFGVGIGEYPARSGEFSSPQLLRQFPPAARENAHNNFLQIGAELGIVGLLAIGWILAVAAVRCARLLKNSVDPLEAENALRWGMATGLLAFVLSWLAGHPLLIDEPAFTFWLLLGVACGWGATANGSAPRARWSAWIVTGLAIAVLLSISARFERQRDNFDLEHRGVGLSEWQDAIEGVRYRLANVTSGVFVPASAQTITVPLRAAKSGETLKVDVRLDGRSADVIAVPPDRWYQFKVVLPHGVEGRRFHRLEFHVMGRSTSETGLLMIGKVEPR
jgi:hypothetical protein